MIIALAILVGIPLLYIVVAYLGTWKKQQVTPAEPTGTRGPGRRIHKRAGKEVQQ